MATQRKKSAAKPGKRPGKRKTRQRLAGALFVLVILIALAIAFDYILFSFQATPIFAVTRAREDGTEHIGLIYVVVEHPGQDGERVLQWDWIWDKYRITRVD